VSAAEAGRRFPAGARFAGRRALVTGAGSGIGEAVARGLHEEGAEVLLADLAADRAVAVAAALGDGRARGIALDVRDEDAVRRVVPERLDVLVNVAGIGSTTNAPETPLELWEDVFAVNARGTFLLCKHAIPVMKRAGGGSIVNIASVAGLVGLRNRAAYCASKGAVIALTRAIAVDHVADGIRANAVCPGTVDTPWVKRLVEDVGESLDALRARQPMGRLGRPDEIAEAVLYLASDAAGFVTGTSFVIDGGLTAA
jgi:2-keto-3-deoxy-L-fuconate dehydrogenase